MNLKRKGIQITLIAIATLASILTLIIHSLSGLFQIYFIFSTPAFLWYLIAGACFIPLGATMIGKTGNLKMALVTFCITGVGYIVASNLALILLSLAIVLIDWCCAKHIHNRPLRIVLSSIPMTICATMLYYFDLSLYALSRDKGIISAAMFIVILLENTIFTYLMEAVARKLEHSDKKLADSMIRKRSVNVKIMLLINVACSIIVLLFGYFSYRALKAQVAENAGNNNLLLQGVIADNLTESVDAIVAGEDGVMDQIAPIVADSINGVPISLPTYILIARQDENDNIADLGYFTIDRTEGHDILYEATWVPSEVKLDNVFLYTYVPGDYRILVRAVTAQKISEKQADVLKDVIGALIVVFVFVNLVAQELVYITLVKPINQLAEVASGFEYGTQEQVQQSKQTLLNLDIHSGDEVESLYTVLNTTMTSMADYITDIKEASRKVSLMQHNVITTMADIIESRDENTGGHVKRTAVYVNMIANKLREEGKYPEILTDKYIENMVVAAPLHDMGKIHVPDAILNKNGRLDDDEFSIMQLHAKIGKELLEHASDQLGTFEYLDVALKMAGSHHEWWNGKGYPEKISGEAIPLCARIMAVADVFDALVSKRCYKEGMPSEKAFSIIEEESGTHFDPVVAQAFLDCKEQIIEYLKK